MFLLKEVKYKGILNIKNLNINKNKITSIVGESGSGKTTLIRLLNKLISSDTGEIYYNNQLIDDIDSVELRRQIVMLPQYPAVFKGNIRDNLLIGLKFSEKPDISDNKLASIMKIIKLDKNLDEDSEKLSGGEKQRLAIGRIIALKPEVLLLDEPSSALDENTENILINSLVNYTKENNKTLIMVTHSKKVALQFSDEIIEIQKNSVIDNENSTIVDREVG